MKTGTLGLALAAGLLLRLAFGFGYWVDKPLTHDEQEYLLLASNLAAGRGFTYGDEPADAPAPERFGRAPGYPAFLSAVVGADAARATSTPASVKIAQAILATAAVWLVACLARRAAGPAAGLAAAWGAAVYPSLVWIPSYVLSETLYSLLALGTAVLLGAVIDTRDRSPLRGRRALTVVAIAGIVAGAAALTRPAMLLCLPLAAIWLVWRHGPRPAVVLAVSALCVVVPWTARNYAVTGRFVLIASEGGITFWTGNHPLARGEGDMAANVALKRANLELRARHAGLTPEELEPIYYREALAFIAEQPLAWLALLARKAFYFVVPIGPSYTLHSPLYYTASVVPYVIVLPFALAGVRRLRDVARPPCALGLLVAGTIATSLIFFPQERFRIPVIDPALVISAAAWWALGRAGHARDVPSPAVVR